MLNRTVRLCALALCLAGGTVAGLVVAPTPAAAQQSLTLRVGESKTLYVGRAPVKVGNPAVIDVQPQGEDSIVVFGIAQGYSSLTIGDTEYDITVLGDVEQLRRDVERLLADSPRVSVFTSGDRVVIDGIVNSREEMERINSIVESNENEVYSLVMLDERQIPERLQVQLHFQFLEVERNYNHQLGIDWSNGPVQLVLDGINYVRFGVDGSLDDYLNLDAAGEIRRVLDQDFFTCVSGEEVTYLRGGELLIITGGIDASFQRVTFGLEVTARPIVDDDGDIDLFLDYENSSPSSFTDGIPTLSTHRHTTHVQLQEGQSFALSGWFNRSRGRNIVGFPGLKDVPVLGLLFGSRDFRRGDTDGIIIVTPVVLDEGGQKMRRQIRETMDIYERADVKW